MTGADHVVGVVALDVAIIVAVCHACRSLIGRLGQPRVVGEIGAGLLLGPTLLGPASSVLFPPDARPLLTVIGELGLIAFMFLVGLEFDTRRLPRRRAVALIGTGAVLVPFAAGLALAPLLFAAYPPAVGGSDDFALFLGVALSITAFPVLARILAERRLERTPLGTVALASAAFNDVVGWCLMAVVIASIESDRPANAAVALFGTALFAVILLAGARPLLAALHARGSLSGGGATGLAIVGMLVCASVTEHLGTHLIFGAFLWGLAWPRGHASSAERRLTRSLTPVTGALFLPVFFATPGLAIDLRGIELGGAGHLCAILAVAVGAKVLGAAAGARLAGAAPRASFALGMLMNTRGLMELVVLNIGFELGVLDPRLYALLVVMAIATTVMTDPVVRWLRPPVELNLRGGR